MAKKNNLGVRLVQTSIRFRPELKDAVDLEVVKRRTTLQAAIELGLEWWLASGEGNAFEGIRTPATGVVENPSGKLGEKDVVSPYLPQIYEQLTQILLEVRSNGETIKAHGEAILDWQQQMERVRAAKDRSVRSKGNPESPRRGRGRKGA